MRLIAALLVLLAGSAQAAVQPHLSQQAELLLAAQVYVPPPALATLRWFYSSYRVGQPYCTPGQYAREPSRPEVARLLCPGSR